jgi:hypothetical protein
MRFNIAVCDDRRVQQWLERTAADSTVKTAVSGPS